jgi:hypothetical protein
MANLSSSAYFSRRSGQGIVSISDAGVMLPARGSCSATSWSIAFTELVEGISVSSNRAANTS